MTRLHLLGPPQFKRDGRDATLSVAKAIALLAFLALKRRPQTRDRLMDLLWPESAPDAARKNLRNTLWAIRRALGDETIRGEHDRLVLGKGVWVDVDRLEQLGDQPDEALSQRQETLDLYRGPFLDGLVLTDAPDFELWLTAERGRLEQLYLRHADLMVDGFRHMGRWSEMIDTARTALRHDNLQEPMYRALMEAHARRGERPEALRQYELLQDVLARELGVAPLEETDDLRAAILRGEIDPATPSLPPRVRQPARARQAGAGTTVPFVGRTRELAALDDELQQAALGQVRVVLLAGEVGIGKSRLWQEWMATLDPALTVLEGAAPSVTQSLPFAPLPGLFTSPPLAQLLFSSPTPLAPAWLAEIARLLPEIREAHPTLPPTLPLPADEERRRLFEAFTQALLALNAAPLVFFVDDIHWADRATLDWLAYLVHRMQPYPLLLVAAYRPQDAPGPLATLLATWGRQGITRRLELAPLKEEETATLLDTLIVDPRRRATVAEQLHARSAGNPYFLIELAYSETGELPPALADLIRERLGRLSAAARQVVQAAGVLAPSFDFNALRHTSGRGEEETLDALDELLAAAVLVEREAAYSFAHPLVAAVVQEALSGARRAFLHRRAAAVRERIYADQLPRVAATLATHHREAGNRSRAAHFAGLAAEHARFLAAPEEATAFYREALALDPTPARRLALGRALALQADYGAAREVLAETLAEFEAAGDRRGAVRACVEMARSYLPVGRADQTRDWAERALSYLDASTDPEGHAAAHFLMGAALLQVDGALGDANDHLVEADRLAQRHDLGAIAATSRFELGNLRAQRGDLEGAVRAYRTSIALAEAAGDRGQVVLGHNNAAYHCMLRGDLAAARTHLEAAFAVAEEYDLRLPLQYLFSTRGEIALAEEAWDEAEEWFRRGLVEAEHNDNKSQIANYHANRALAARGRGDHARALTFLERARKIASEQPASHLQIKIDLWLAESYLHAGQPGEARAALARAEGRLADGERAGLIEWAAQLRAQPGIDA